MKSKVLFVAVGLLASFSVAGCSERQEQAAEQTAGQTGAEVREETRQAGDAVEGAAGQVAKETQDAAQVMFWTPRVKNALSEDPETAKFVENINVDSSGETDTVTITGTVPSEAAKNRVTRIAEKVIAGKAEIKNNVTVSSATAQR